MKKKLAVFPFLDIFKGQYKYRALSSEHDKIEDDEQLVFIFRARFSVSANIKEKKILQTAYKRNALVIIDQSYEGWGETFNTLINLNQRLIDETSETFVKNNVLLLTGCMNIKQSVYNDVLYNIIPTTCMADWLKNFFNINFQHSPKKKEKLFLCLNRIPKIHRSLVSNFLVSNDFHKTNTYLSFFRTSGYGPKNKQVFDDPVKNCTWIPEDDKHEIIKNLNGLDDDLYLDNINPYNNQAHSFLSEHVEKSYINIVTESFYDEKDVFYSEKTYKPLVSKQPFILVSSYKSLETLKDLGFKTFSPFINEEYDLIKDPYERIKCIFEEMTRLSTLSKEELDNMIEQLRERCEFNRKKLLLSYDQFRYSWKFRSFLDTELSYDNQ